MDKSEDAIYRRVAARTNPKDRIRYQMLERVYARAVEILESKPWARHAFGTYGPDQLRIMKMIEIDGTQDLRSLSVPGALCVAATELCPPDERDREDWIGGCLIHACSLLLPSIACSPLFVKEMDDMQCPPEVVLAGRITGGEAWQMDVINWVISTTAMMNGDDRSGGLLCFVTAWNAQACSDKQRALAIMRESLSGIRAVNKIWQESGK